MPDTATAFAAFAKTLRRACDASLPDLAPTTILAEVVNIDSLRLLQAIALAEEELGIEIDTGALDAAWTVRDIVMALAEARPAARDP
jgi:acyl carrier protein